MAKQTTAKARVQVTLEVEAGSGWGEECTIGQLYKQAEESAMIAVNNAIGKSGINARVIGDAKVIGILTEKS